GGKGLPYAQQQRPDAHFDPRLFPVAAAQRLHSEGLPSGPSFTTFEWGGYLEFALPGYHPFIDSRSDAYDEQLLRDYSAIINLTPDWLQLLDRYAIRWALVPSRAPIAQALTLAPGWYCAPADDAGFANLCQRQTAPNVLIAG